MKIVLNDQQKLNELIFAKRNKNYGAYAIRTSYNNTLLRSLIIVSSTVLVLFTIVYILTRVKEEKKNDNVSQLTCIGVPVDFTPPERPRPSTPQTPSQRAPRSNALSTVISDTADTRRPEALNVNANPNGSPTGDTGYVAGAGIPAGTGSLVANTPTVEEIPEAPQIDPDEGPEFDGGVAALGEFIRSNVVYPSLARDIGKEGTVYVSFVVNEKGYVQNATLLRGIGAGCDEEAIRVVNKIPKFKKPGKKAGHVVKVIYNIPIKFRLK